MVLRQQAQQMPKGLRRVGAHDLYRFMTWLSPSFPIGAFSYSHGLEWVIEQGRIKTSDQLKSWIAELMNWGSARNDAFLCAFAWRGAKRSAWMELSRLAELGTAMSPSMERRLETSAQGLAFVKTIAASWPCETVQRLVELELDHIPYPVAVGTVAAGHHLDEGCTLQAFLHAFASNLVSVGLRLIPLGQTDGQRIIAALEADIFSVSNEALRADITDLGSATILSDIASMNHERQYSRLFRS